MSGAHSHRAGHRAVRPRWGRLAVASTSVAVTAVAVLGGAGLLPPTADQPARASAGAPAPSAERQDEPAQDGSDVVLVSGPVSGAASERDPGTEVRDEPGEPVLPDRSGSGRRVVFSESEQRVWLVDRRGDVAGSWLVSGSLTDNLQPGTYDVWSRSRHAVGIDDSGTMEYFVRFAHGQRAAIGFHDIPVDDGERVQTFGQLGTPQSHGCIRQRRSDAIRMWDFAQLGTTVVVTA